MIETRCGKPCDAVEQLENKIKELTAKLELLNAREIDRHTAPTSIADLVRFII